MRRCRAQRARSVFGTGKPGAELESEGETLAERLDPARGHPRIDDRPRVTALTVVRVLVVARDRAQPELQARQGGHSDRRDGADALMRRPFTRAGLGHAVTHRKRGGQGGGARLRDRHAMQTRQAVLGLTHIRCVRHCR
jgi:hypothetical protein